MIRSEAPAAGRVVLRHHNLGVRVARGEARAAGRVALRHHNRVARGEAPAAGMAPRVALRHHNLGVRVARGEAPAAGMAPRLALRHHNLGGLMMTWFQSKLSRLLCLRDLYKMCELRTYHMSQRSIYTHLCKSNRFQTSVSGLSCCCSFDRNCPYRFMIQFGASAVSMDRVALARKKFSRQTASEIRSAITCQRKIRWICREGVYSYPSLRTLRILEIPNIDFAAVSSAISISRCWRVSYIVDINVNRHLTVLFKCVHTWLSGSLSIYLRCPCLM